MLCLPWDTSTRERRGLVWRLRGSRGWTSSERLNKKQIPPDWFNKHGNMPTRLLLGDSKMCRSLHMFTRILNVYIAALMGLSYIFSPDGLINVSSLKAASLKYLQCANNWWNVHSKKRGGFQWPLIAQVQLAGQWVVMPSQWLFPGEWQRAESLGLNP